jgi:type I restriction enzyme, S subunit
MTEYPFVHMGSFLRERKEFITIDDMEVYKRAKVQWYGKGTILRDKVPGIEIKTKQQQVIRTNEFVVAEIDAKDGSFGVTPEELDGAIVSSHYFVYEIDQNLCLPSYLEWYVRTNNLQVLVKAQGSTNYSAIRSYTVYDYEIPLPPLTEQQRIVAYIDSMAARINDALRLREDADSEMNAFLLSAYHQAFQPKSNWTMAKVGDFCDNPQYGYTESAKSEPVGPKFLRITDIQDGKVNWDSVPYCECPQPEKYLLKPNDIVFARTGATTGKSFLIRECPEAVFASYLIRLRVVNSVTPEYLYAFFQSPNYWSQVTDEKKGTGQPNVNGQKLANIRVPIPPLEEQQRLVAYLDGLQTQVSALREAQSATERELSALMPSVLDRAFKGEL